MKQSEPCSRLLVGPNPQALLDCCLDELHQWQSHWPRERAFLVVPEDRKLATEQRYFECFPNQALLLTDVVSFTRLADLLTEAMEGSKTTPLQRGDKILLLRNLLFRHAEGFPKLMQLGRRVGYLEKILDVLGDWQRSRYTPHEIQTLAQTCTEISDLAATLAEWAELLRLYQDALVLGSYSDFESRMEALGGYLETAVDLQSQGLPPEHWPFPYQNLAHLTRTWFWITGFGESRLFTPQEQRILHALAQLSPQLTLTVCSTVPVTQDLLQTEHPTARFSVPPESYFAIETAKMWMQRFPSTQRRFIPSPLNPNDREWVVLEVDRPETEIQLCLAELCRLHEEKPSRPWNSYAIALCDPSMQSRLAATLQTLGIPSTLDRRQPLAGSPVLRYLSGLIQIQETGWSRDATVAFLRTGLTGLEPEEIDELENFWLARGMDHLLLFESQHYQPHWYLTCDTFNQPEQIGREAEAERFEPAPCDEEVEDRDFMIVLQQAQVCQSYRQKALDPVRTFLANLPRRTRAQEWVERLIGFFEQQGLQSCVENQVQEAAKYSESQALNLSLGWKQMLEYFQSLCTLMPDAPITLGELQELLMDSLQGRFAETLPIAADTVSVGTPEEVLGHSYEVLFLLGAGAESFPGVGNDQGLLRDVHRQWIQTQGMHPFPVRSETAVEQRAALLHRLREGFSWRLYCSGVETAHLPHWIQTARQTLQNRCEGQSGDWVASYAEWKAQLPIDQLEDVRLILPEYASYQKTPQAESAERKEVSLQEGAALGQVEGKIVHLQREELEILFPQPLRMSITQLERYRSCPYAYFVHHLLRAKPRAVFVPNRAHLGSLLHSALALFLEPWVGLSAEQLALHMEQRERVGLSAEREAHALLERVLRENPKEFVAFSSSGIRTSIGRKAQRVLQEAVVHLTDEWKSTAQETIWIPAELEQGFLATSFPLLEKWGEHTHYELGGVLDRVDLCSLPSGTGVRILDYKTGARKLDWNRLYYGMDLQLPLYLLAYQQAHPERELRDANYRSLQFQMNEVKSQLFLGNLEGQSKRSTRSQTEGLGRLCALTPPDPEQDGGTGKADQNGLDLLLSHSQRQAARLVQRMLQGEMNTQPVTLSSTSPACSYCACRSLCGVMHPARVQCKLSPVVRTRKSADSAKERELLLAIQQQNQEDEHA